ncbi:hypothetical protein BG55_06295 [Erwinia mallotivora]|uniref:AMP-dependent synthetase/ligase domain-containing protein n=1 Tax=Erwinia mallotivora TaxID=69222 RepID=A0A014ME14_9GAMM|nr:hypothetical protein BG55_06295 [Erwinia mallotivora]
MNIYSYLILSCYRNRDNVFLIENDSTYTYNDLLGAIISQKKRFISQINEEGINRVDILEGNAFSLTVFLMLALSAGIHLRIKNRTSAASNQLDNGCIDSRTYQTDKNCYDETEIQKFLTETIINDKSEHFRLSLFSSGSSSGQPTEMIASSKNLFFSLMSISSVLKYNNHSRIGFCTPLSFDYSLYQILMSLSAGASVVYYDFREYLHRVFVKFSEHKANCLALIPAILKHYVIASKNDPSLYAPVQITLTGETFTQQLYDSCKLVLPETHIITMYGITECKRVSIMPLSCCAVDSQCCGVAIPGITIAVRDLNSSALMRQGKGECIVRGDNVLLGYQDSGPCQFINTDEGRALFTGDRINLTAEGYVYFEGRESEMIKINGVRIDTRPLIKSINDKFSLKLKIKSADNFIEVISKNITEDTATLELFIKNYINNNHGITIRGVEFKQISNSLLNHNLKE